MNQNLNYPFTKYVLITALAAVISLTSNTVYAQTDADFSRYCRENFPGSLYEKTEQSWGIQHNCNQQGTRQGIDFSQACRLTTGSPAHEILGDRVICYGEAQSDADRVQAIAGPLDIAGFCIEKHPGSIPEARPEPTGIKHYCRQPGANGGFTLHAIDLAQACEEQRNVRGFIDAGVQVLCVNSGATAGNGAGEGGGGGGGGGGFPDLGPEDVIEAKDKGRLLHKSVQYANLQGCGNADPDFMLKLPPTSMKRGLGEQTFDYMGLTMSCPGLKNGKVVSFEEVCNQFSGSNPPMQARLLPNGLPICWQTGRAGWPPKDGEAGWGLNSNSLTGVCNQAYFGRPPNPNELKEENITALLKYQVRSLEVECFYLPTNLLLWLLETKGDSNHATNIQSLLQVDATVKRDYMSGGEGKNNFQFIFKGAAGDTLNNGDMIEDYEFGEVIQIEGQIVAKERINMTYDAQKGRTLLTIQFEDPITGYANPIERTITLLGDKRGVLAYDPNCCSNATMELAIEK
ncbi:MAG: hypothetical protein AAGA53_10125 [Pseudomonadota bacterium]